MVIKTDAAGRRYQLSDGRVYDLDAWTVTAAADVAADGGPFDHPGEDRCVPVYCRDCFAGTPWAVCKSVDVLLEETFPAETAGVAGVAGVACIFSDDDAVLLGDAQCGGDIDGGYLKKYRRPLEFAADTFHPKPAELRYGHDLVVGDVHSYWHVHRPGKVYLNAYGVIRDADASRLVERYIQDANSAVALSLGTYQTGGEECVAEASVVLVPARRGCFGEVGRDRDAMRGILGKMCYGECPDGVNAAAFSAAVEAGCATAGLSVRERLLQTTADMLTTQRDLLRITKTHRDSNLEKYINYGLREYRDLTGTLQDPKILTASLDLADAPPAMNVAATDPMSALTGKVSPDVLSALITTGINALSGRMRRGGGKKVRYVAAESDSSEDEEPVRRKRSRRAARRGGDHSDDDEIDRRRSDRGRHGGAAAAAAAAPQAAAASDGGKQEAFFDAFQKFLEARTGPAVETPPKEVIAAEAAVAAAAPQAVPVAEVVDGVKAAFVSILKQELADQKLELMASMKMASESTVPQATQIFMPAPAVTEAAMTLDKKPTEAPQKPPASVHDFFKDIMAVAKEAK